MMFDTHSHLNFKAFDKDRQEVVKRTLANDVWLINVGTNYQNSRLAVEIAEKYDKGIFAAIGFHPIHLSKDEFNNEQYRGLAKSNKVVAIGEVGLDYLNLPEETEIKDKQKEILLKQLDLAKELDLPVIFHCRKAHGDLLDILKFRIQSSKLPGVIHCFTGNWRQAEEYLAMGFYLGFNGIIYKMNLKEIIKKIPLERILVETDCPFLTPPAAGAERNEPIFVKHIIQSIAEIREESFEEIVQTTSQNAKNLFLKKSP